uniref:ATP synthase complex subunit 8 n=1 Tax=Monognathus jesperseni TaxID=556250 RepID=D1YUC7_9TELE|nr:ATPase subunit 8 [Monognathus jesperseni]
MPQLNLMPWFMVFMVTWLLLTMLPPTKVASHLFLTEPEASATEGVKPAPWNWPWY